MGVDPDGIVEIFVFDTILAPVTLTSWMIFVVIFSFIVCALGVRSGVEKVTKFMMSGFYVLLIIMMIRALTLPQMEGVATNALDGLKFFFLPDMAAVAEHGLPVILFRAMGQAFFSLSLGMGSMLIFGSYCGKDKSLPGESRNVIGLDLAASIGSGLIIFPACFAFGIEPTRGAGLLFMAMPNIFNAMPLGQLFAVIFFLFLIFATITTVIAVFENIIAFWMDVKKWTRKKSVGVNVIIVFAGAFPTALGFNVLDPFFAPMLSWLGEEKQMIDLFDFIVSQNILPLGSAIFVIFCAVKNGWGYDNFVAEVNTGDGMKWPRNFKFYYTYVIPVLIVIIFILGYIDWFIGI